MITDDTRPHGSVEPGARTWDPPVGQTPKWYFRPGRRAPLPRPAPTQIIWLRNRLVVAAVFASPFLSIRVAGGITPSDLLFAAAAVLSVVCTDRVRFSDISSLVLTVSVAAGVLASSISSGVPSTTLALAARMIFVMYVLPSLLTRAQSGAKRVGPNTVPLVYGLGASLAVGASAFPSLTGAIGFPISFASSGRVAGLAGHVNDAGGVVASAAPLLVSLLLRDHRARSGESRPPARIVLLALGLLTLGLFLTGSVSGLMATVVGVGLVVVASMRRRAGAADRPRRRAVRRRLVLAAVVGGPVIWRYFVRLVGNRGGLTPFQRILQTLGIQSYTTGANVATASSRWTTYRYAAARIADNPLIGVGATSPKLRVVDPGGAADGLEIHNIVLHAWLLGGALAGLAIAFVFVRVLRVSTRAWRRGTFDGVHGAACAAVLFSMTNPSLYNRYVWLPVALLMTGLRLNAPTDSPGKRAKQATARPIVR